MRTDDKNLEEVEQWKDFSIELLEKRLELSGGPIKWSVYWYF